MPDLPTLWILNCVPLELLHGQQAESLLQAGETLICLKNKPPFVNGSLWRVLGCDEPRTVVRTYVTKTGVVRESKWQGLPGEPGKPGTPVELEVVRLYLVSADTPGQPAI